ncbi:MAG TPA: hypothetical protein VHM31_14320 [Polyangia bacterium]|nr:hypothetical protein [Polyangia bacterium]
MNRIGQAVLIAVLSIVGLSGAHAAGKRVGVPKFNGAQEALVRKKVMQVLKAHGYELVRSRDMQSAADIAGVSLSSDDGLRAVAKELALVAIVTGSVSGKHAKLAVHDGSDGSTLGEANFAGASPRKLGGEVGAAFWRKLGGEVTRGKLPSGAKKDQKSSAPEADEDKEDTGEAAGGAAEENESGKSKAAGESESGAAAEETGSSKKKSKHEEAAAEESAPSAPTGLPWLDLSIGFAGLNRNLSYHQVAYPPANQPSPYSLPFWPVGVVNAVFYLEPLVGGLLGNLGVEAHGMLGLGVSSKLSSNTTSYSSTVHDFSGGARYRFPFGAANDLFLSATYGEDAFTFNGSNRSSLLTPDTIYHYFRGGFGVQLALTNEVKLDAGGGYRAVLNKAGSQISTAFFPHLTVAGADAEAALTWSFSDYYALRAGIAWKRYWYDMHSRQGDTFLVGGAVDQSFLFSLSLVVQVSSGAHGEAEAAPAEKKEKPAKGGDAGEGGGSEGGGGDGGKTSGGAEE